MTRRRKPRAAGARRRRARNPRTGARGDAGHGGEPQWAPLEVILEVSRGALADSRAMIENTATKDRADAEIQRFLLRIIAQLEILCDRAPEGEGEELIFSLAWTTLAVTLDLEWLEARHWHAPPGLSRRDLDDIQLLKRIGLERAGRPDGVPAGGRWDDLFQLVFDATTMFILFQYWEGVRGCLELHRELARQALAEQPDGSPPS